MGAKPSTLPRWADVGGAIVVPSSGKLDVGWVAAERPPAQYLNWYQNLVYLWIVFVGAYFTNGGAATGATDLGHAAEATITPMSVWRDYNQKIRAVVDHNGYRMGQLSEIEEHWSGETVTVSASLAAGHIAAGAPTLTNGTWRLTVAAQAIVIPLSSSIPIGAIVTGVAVKHQRTTGTDSFTLDLESSTETGAGTAATSISSITVTTGTGAATTQMLASKQFIVGPASATSILGPVNLRVTCNAVTTNDHILDVEITYIMPPPSGWSVFSDNLGTGVPGTEDTFSFVDPDANINHRSLKMQSARSAAAAAGNMGIQTTKYETYFDANCAYAIEFMIRTGNITDATNKRKFLAGVNLGASEYVTLFNSFVETNWQLQVIGSAGGSTVNTDSGVAIAANTNYRVRIEIYGSSVNSSGNTKVRLYINGSKVVEVNTATLAANMLRPYFQVACISTTGGSYDWRIGRIRRVWNHLLTPDNL